MTVPVDEVSCVANKTSVPDTLQELKDLLVSYAKQETIDPLRNVGRFLGFGLGGIMLLSLGTVLLALAALRALQTQTGDVFAGFWSWAPYLIVMVGLLAVTGVVASRITKGGLGTPVEPSSGKAR
ncbi:phage holin family protein [Rhabdothermincola salaria]|uniref:phage holin family protein n=1 Tax=Rhabdothermincola salaria TaxID=2903142 RepID=UPI001E3CF9F8|nr:phage holin family protein [Rhabdothermincola salaria]MCD9623059.1 phage holin family protein [Rhabdothermincola salaria]